MPKKTLAAVLAAAVLLPLLVFVDPPAADAHPKTKTVRRCAYDPFAGRQCWNETVSVRHYHTPVQRNLPEPCPAGTTGTPPNCLPIPSDNTRRVTPTTAAPTTTTTAAPTTTTAPPPPTQAPPECPPGYIGTPPNCKLPPPPKCPPGTVGTWPNCTTSPTTTKATPPTTAPPDCTNGEHRHTLGAQRNRGGGTTSACHDASASHCNSGHHAHVHGSQECHKTTTKELKNNPCENGLALDASWQSRRAGTAGCFTMHCPAGQHEHVHGSRNCHPENTNHDPDCPAGYFWNGTKCENNPLSKIADYVVFTVGGDVVCTFAAGGLGQRAANLIVKGGKKLYTWLAGAATEEYILRQPCDRVWDRYVESQKPPSEVDPDGPTPTTAAPTPTTAPPTPTTAAPTPEADPIPERPNTEQYLREYQRYSDAVRKHQRGEISAADRIAAAQRYKQVRCNRGDQDYC